MEHIGPEIERLLNIIDERRRQEANEGIKAWILAPDIEVYQALMRGEKVPQETLNQNALERYGRRAREAR